ncbi:hypothetical protein I6F33_37010 [Bradyrhizobium sp. BRP20]|uniref:hypothetical protein n=1 Tax=Bradyrhizobium sp. BRP20 TaxID=2793822 RepID=UPI001CD2447D|nr:hypothetical protein [Bradyrhizobium sp. BRP20]MCA1438484.1 hypothetical protein [Bradyrhizobium sp. BRP20]
MPEFDAAIWFLAATTCFAAFVNGAIGYGFSSLTVPFALALQLHLPEGSESMGDHDSGSDDWWRVS